MDEPKKPRSNIKTPASDKKREGARAVAEAAASLIPGGGALARLYRTTHPPKSEQDRKEWQSQITERSNDHSDQLDRHERIIAPTYEIKGPPVDLIVAMIQQCTDGRSERIYTLQDLRALLPQHDEQIVKDAIFELVELGLLSRVQTMSVIRVRLTERAYDQVDEHVMGWSPRLDALELAELMLETEEGRSALLCEALGWTKRRFNPAVRYLLRHLPDDRVSNEIDLNFEIRGITLVDEDLAALRRFARQSEV